MWRPRKDIMHVRSLRFVLASALLAPGAQAAVLTVGPGADCTTSSLGAAIFATSQVGGADEIRVSAGTTYTDQKLTISNQSLTISGGWSSCAANATPIGRTLVSGNGVDSVLTARESSGSRYTLALDRLDISNGGGGSPGVISRCSTAFLLIVIFSSDRTSWISALRSSASFDRRPLPA